MGRKGKSIYKYTDKGKLVAVYGSVTMAAEQEGLSRYYIEIAIADKQTVNGHTFSMHCDAPEQKKRVALMKTRPQPERVPWDNGKGMFDIDGWAKTFQNTFK